MKKLFAAFKNIFKKEIAKPKTVDSILTDFKSHITDLRQLSEGHNRTVDVNVLHINELVAENQALSFEAVRADNVAAKLTELIS